MNRRKGIEPIQLTIFRQGSILTLELGERKTVSFRNEVEVGNEFLGKLQSRVNRLVDYANRWAGKVSITTGAKDERQEGVLSELKNIGQVMYDQVLSEPVKRRLTQSPPTELFLKTDESLVSVPWELIFDGNVFLCNKFRIGRQIATGTEERETPPGRELSPPLKMLIISDPTENLEGARRECEALLSELSRFENVEITMCGGKRVDKIWLLGNIGRFDIVQYAGHAFYSEDEPEKSGWLLSGDTITAREMSRISNPPSLVFSNACQAGTGPSEPRKYRYQGETFGIGSGFLLAGVENYIGPFWVVHDEPSVQFALTFYQSLFRGKSLGESIQASRREIINHYGWGELLWAAHILYGNPQLRLAEGQEKKSVAAIPMDEAEVTSVRSWGTEQQDKVTVKSADVGEERKSARSTKKGALVALLLAAIVAAGTYLYLKNYGIKPKSLFETAGESQVREEPVVEESNQNEELAFEETHETEEPAGEESEEPEQFAPEESEERKEPATEESPESEEIIEPEIPESQEPAPGEEFAMLPPVPPARITSGQFPGVVIDITERIDGLPSRQNVVEKILKAAFSKEGVKIIDKGDISPVEPTPPREKRKISLPPKQRRTPGVWPKSQAPIAVIGKAESSFLKKDNFRRGFVYTAELTVKVIDTVRAEIIMTKSAKLSRGSGSREKAAILSLRAVAEEICHEIADKTTERYKALPDRD